jgi:LysM repeat protein
MAGTVKVKSGDTMSALAKKAGVSLKAFIAANPQITNPNLIRPGQVLNVPDATGNKKEKAYIANFENPITSQYDPRIDQNGRVNSGGTVDSFDPAKVGVMTGGTGGTGGWVKAGTVQTEDGAVDVDANGIAADGSKPTPKAERTMAIDTFRKTLGTFFGEQEVSQAWVDALYKVTSNYYKTGSTIDESLNLALKDARNNPELAPFTKRFKGLFEIQDKALAGEMIEVPTIAEFYKSQFELGEVMKRAGFPDLATNEFLGDVLGTGKSVAETTALINDVFAAIDNAPEALKADLQKVAPGADRTAIAKALLLGSKGAAALTKDIAAATVVSAAKSQGLTLDTKTGADYAARGFGYGETLTTAGNVMRGAAPLEKLTEISTGAAVTPEQARATLQQSLFENNVDAQEKIRLEAEKEEARFGSRPGTMGSRSLASRNRAERVI